MRSNLVTSGSKSRGAGMDVSQPAEPVPLLLGACGPIYMRLIEPGHQRLFPCAFFLLSSVSPSCPSFIP